MAERLNAPVLKTGGWRHLVGSNPTPSARSTTMNDRSKPADPRAWELDALEESWARHSAQLRQVVRPLERQTLQPLVKTERMLPQWPS